MGLPESITDMAALLYGCLSWVYFFARIWMGAVWHSFGEFIVRFTSLIWSCIWQVILIVPESDGELCLSLLYPSAAIFGHAFGDDFLVTYATNYSSIWGCLCYCMAWKMAANTQSHRVDSYT